MLIIILHLIIQYKTYLVMAYTTNLILYSNINHMNFTKVTLVYSVAKISGWIDISSECTDKITSCHSFFYRTQQYGPQLKKPEVVSYIQDNKTWESIIFILKLLYAFLWVFHIAGSNKAGMEKIFCYYKMTKIFVFKSSYDLDNK